MRVQSQSKFRKEENTGEALEIPTAPKEVQGAMNATPRNFSEI